MKPFIALQHAPYKISAASGVSAIRANNVARDFIVRGNALRSSTTNPDRYAMELSNPDTSVNFIESDNTFILNPALGILSYPNIPYKFAVQGNARVHYATAAPTNGTWAVGDIVWRNNFTVVDSGGAMGWVCVVAGTPGTWYEFGSISKSIDKEYGSLRLRADTINVGTAFVQFATTENRPRSLETVSWAADSLKITNSGRYRISGFLNCASGGAGAAVQVGVSINNANPLGEFITEHYFINASQFANIPFNYFIQLGPNKSVKLKFRRTSGSGEIYIKNGWLTVERLN